MKQMFKKITIVLMLLFTNYHSKATIHTIYIDVFYGMTNSNNTIPTTTNYDIYGFSSDTIEWHLIPSYIMPAYPASEVVTIYGTNTNITLTPTNPSATSLVIDGIFQGVGFFDWMIFSTYLQDDILNPGFPPVTVMGITQHLQLQPPPFSLPLILQSFTAELNDENITLLKWSASAENNTLMFEVEKSIDATNWKMIHQHKASKESSVEKTYQALDTEVLSGTTFYRIKQLDIDGKFIYSPVRKVYRDSSLETIIYPNPVMDNLHISTNINLPTSIKIYTLDGKQLVNVNSNEATLSLNVASLPKGAYVIRISNTEKTYTSKFVRQ